MISCKKMVRCREESMKKNIALGTMDPGVDCFIQFNN